MVSGDEGLSIVRQLQRALRAVELDLSGRKLWALPSEIGELSSLQQLDLSQNNLTELPPEFGQLVSLQQLDLSENNLTELPLEVCQLSNLKRLYLRDNQLTELPPEICQLTSLQELDLGFCQLTELPLEVCELTGLQELSLNGNDLTELPPEIGQLINLLDLNLGENRLTELPPEFGHLHSLQHLTLGEWLSTLPPEIIQLIRLQRLILSNNRLTELPPEIGQLTNLRELDLRENRLTELPPEFGRLTSLQRLDLGNGNQPTLPLEIDQPNSPQHLNLGNRLTELPPGFGKLASLQWLDLSVNRLVALPPEFGQLTSLQRLDLSENRLVALPPEFWQLTSLQHLYLSGNQLAELPPEVGQLTRLYQLSLGGNQLAELPPEIGQLTRLQRLDLGGNRLTALPPEVGQLTSLQQLYLSRNQLTSLPQQLANLLTADLFLDLKSNPLNEPFSELVERGIEALAAYLHSLEEDAVPLYEAKVLLVGEGNVGKTSLVAALCGAPFKEGRPTTHGIEIQPVTMRHPDLGVDMIVRAWDFGGQEVYRISHQFFFSRRALYLVVWSAREGQEQNEVEGWLRRIRLRVSQDARALVVATHCAERQPELDYPYLERAFPQLLVGRYAVDNFTGIGIPELHEGVAKEVARLPQMGQLISPRWIAARNDVLARAQTDPQIPYRLFADICRCHGVDGNEVTTLAELMHDLGQIVYYGDDEGLQDFVVLDPEWLTKAISYILEDKLTQQSGGILDHARLAEIWQNREDELAYPVQYHPYFLRLMEKFDVSYRLDDDEYRSLVAQLVPHARPDLPWENSTPPLHGIRSLSLVCQLSESVPGLIAWLTVRHHRASTGKHWRYGVFLRHPIAAYMSEALIELRTPDQLALDVRAPSPDMYFSVLRDSVEDLITRRWPGLSYRLLVPCPTRTADGLRCRGKFPLKFLLGYREQGGTHAPCHECFVEWNISELLTGFAQPDLPLQQELEQLQDQVANIGSGVRRLEGGVGRLERYAAETADSMRRVLRVVSSEITDCPRLFTLTEEIPVGARRLRKALECRYRLVLWCEHQGCWHPWPAASYSLDKPRDWLLRVAPYANLIFRALRLVVPIAASVTDMVMTDKQLKRAQNELKLMTTLVADLPDQTIEDRRELSLPEFGSRLTSAQGQAARALRMVLFENDHIRAFGGMHRVQAPSGDFLWVCPRHYTEYDPGLPSIP